MVLDEIFSEGPFEGREGDIEEHVRAYLEKYWPQAEGINGHCGKLDEWCSQRSLIDTVYGWCRCPCLNCQAARVSEPWQTSE